MFLLAQGVALLLVGRVLSGLSAGIFTGTATATLVDLVGSRRGGRATLIAALANMVGLGCGPLLAGILAQTAPHPLRLPFWVDLGLLVLAALGVLLIAEPVQARGARACARSRSRCRREMRATFVSAALAAFAGFAVLGLSTAVSPAFLGQALGVKSLAVIGLVVFGVFVGSAAGQLLLEVVPDAAAHAGGLSRADRRHGAAGGGTGGVLAGPARRRRGAGRSRARG